MITVHIFKNNIIKKISFENLSKKDLGGKIWIDINQITKEESEKIKELFDLHQLVVEDLINSGTRVKIEEFKNYLFLIFYTLRKNKKIELVELDFIFNKNLLITNHKISLASFEALKNNSDKLLKLFSKGTDFLFHYLIDKEIDEFFPSLEKINDSIEEMEDEAISKPNTELMSRILKLKKKVNRVRKVNFANREKFSYLTKNDLPYISKKALPYLRDVYDHIIRASDISEDSKESITNVYDVYMSTLSNSMNEVMKTLSIFATIFLPLGVISGIYGTNFLSLPGANFIYGFWSMIGIMFLISFIMVLVFKKKKWF